MIKRSQFSHEQSIEMDIFKSDYKPNAFTEILFREPPFQPHTLWVTSAICSKRGASAPSQLWSIRWGNLHSMGYLRLVSNQTSSHNVSSRRFSETRWSYDFGLGIWESSHITGFLKCHGNFGKLLKLKSQHTISQASQGRSPSKQNGSHAKPCRILTI